MRACVLESFRKDLAKDPSNTDEMVQKAMAAKEETLKRWVEDELRKQMDGWVEEQAAAEAAEETVVSDHLGKLTLN